MNITEFKVGDYALRVWFKAPVLPKGQEQNQGFWCGQTKEKEKTLCKITLTDFHACRGNFEPIPIDEEFIRNNEQIKEIMEVCGMGFREDDPWYLHEVQEVYRGLRKGEINFIPKI